MRLKNPELTIPKDDPFKEDAFREQKESRKESAEILTQFISTIQEPFVLAVDSPWGTGKTTFLKMWKQHLENEGSRCLFFNAWSNDFYDDPLIPLIGEIRSALDDLSEPEKTRTQEIVRKFKDAGAALVKRAIPALIKIGTHGILDLDENAESEIADTARKIAEKQIDEYEKKKQSISGFRKHLEKVVESLAASKDGNPKPLVFFIDELDRCRPTYAIELLERVKHLFGIKGIVFVLAVDKEQIVHSIRCIYGSGMDVDGYLRRFIDMDYRLPDGNPEVFCRFLLKECELEEYLIERSKSKSSQDGDLEYTYKTIGCLSSIFGLSLRKQEHCVSRLSVVARTTRHNVTLVLPVLSLLLVLKESDANLYRSYVKGEVKPEAVIDRIRQTPVGLDFLSAEAGQWFRAWFYAAAHEKYRKEVLAFHQGGAESTSVSPEEKELSGRVGLIYERHFLIQLPDPLGYLVRKIEIAERFTQ